MDKSIEQRIAKLEEWQRQKTDQQITYPLDNKSLIVLQKYFMTVIGNLYNVAVSGQEFRKIMVEQNNKIYVISVVAQFISFTVNTTTDVLTLGIDRSTGGQGELSDDQFVTLNSLGTPPAPLENGSGYFVVNSTGTTIQLSDTLGGAPIDITTTGSSTNYLSSE